MSLRFGRAPRLFGPRLVLLVVFVVATSLSLVVASYGSASAPKAEPGYWLVTPTGAVSAYGGRGSSVRSMAAKQRAL